jgi:hypothetical protein
MMHISILQLILLSVYCYDCQYAIVQLLAIPALGRPLIPDQEAKMRTRHLSTIGVIVVSLCNSATAWSVSRTQTTLCAVAGDTSQADLLDRGIYVTGYPGNNLSQVELSYVASAGHAGTYSISLTARRGTYDGPIIGSTQTATIKIGDTAGGVYSLVFFDFGGAPVTPGDIITFTQSFEQLDGTSGGDLFFNTGGGSCPGVFETEGTTPPLDTPRRNSAAILTNAVNLSTSCVPSDTVLCVDNNPGDRRFQVTASFQTSQGGGFSGNGQEIPIAPLGVIHGGLFWFFGADNPELLIKMVDGCALDSHFWVFISAGTNVAFTVNVLDTATGHTAIYSNPDRTAALAVQDTAALTCP